MKKVSRDDLRKMEVGEVKRFVLDTSNACSSAAVTAGQLKPEGFVFSVNCTLEMKMRGEIIFTRVK